MHCNSQNAQCVCAVGGLGWGVEWTTKLDLSKKGKTDGVKYMVEDCVPEESDQGGIKQREKKGSLTDSKSKAKNENFIKPMLKAKEDKGNSVDLII